MVRDKPLSVIFLDIDGVLCPKRAHLDPDYPKIPGYSQGRTPCFDPFGAGAVKRLCLRFAPACIVINSSWNRGWMQGARDREMDRAGLARWSYARQHPQDPNGAARSRTGYPENGGRLESIRQWIEEIEAEGREMRWTALDDAPMEDERAVRVDAWRGIQIEDYEQATRILGKPDRLVVL